jgi:2-isopropylmalate synthase
MCAFGMTRRAGRSADNDPGLQALLGAGTRAVCMVGKTWDFHVRVALDITQEENIAMIADSVRLAAKRTKEVIFDAEHFFDGYAENPAYALATLRAAARGGASTVALCDTNGGSLPDAIVEGVAQALGTVDLVIGIHTHNDAELAVANTLLAVQAGATQVQACLNGWGERCGNANIISVIANLKLKLGMAVVSDDQLASLTEVARFASEVANLPPNAQQPYVGTAAFAHKAGLHAAAIAKSAGSYTHIDPATVGNNERVLVSELSGRRSITAKLLEQGTDIELTDDQARTVLAQVKDYEARGFQYESAEASFELLVRRSLDGYIAPFDLEDFLIVERRRHTADDTDGQNEMQAEAMVKVRVGDRLTQTAADGVGPVSALDAAVRKGLAETFPELSKIRLVDYKVRIINPAGGADATVRTLIESSDGLHVWRTVGASTDVIEASWIALQDAYEYWVLHWGHEG